MKKHKYPPVKHQKPQEKPRAKRPPSDLVPNANALAKALGVAAVTVKAWKRIEGCPVADGSGRFRVSEWKAWALAQGRRIDEQPPGAATKADWEIERLKRVVQRMDMEIAKEREELIPIETLRAWFIPVLLDVRNTLLSIPGKLAAQVPGMEPPAAEAAIRDAINEALTHISSHPWEEEEPAQKDSVNTGTNSRDAESVNTGALVEAQATQ